MSASQDEDSDCSNTRKNRILGRLGGTLNGYKSRIPGLRRTSNSRASSDGEVPPALSSRSAHPYAQVSNFNPSSWLPVSEHEPHTNHVCVETSMADDDLRLDLTLKGIAANCEQGCGAYDVMAATARLLPSNTTQREQALLKELERAPRSGWAAYGARRLLRAQLAEATKEAPAAPAHLAEMPAENWSAVIQEQRAHALDWRRQLRSLELGNETMDEGNDDDEEEEDESPQLEFKVGELVWAKYRQYPFWPGQICESNIEDHEESPETVKLNLWVGFFGDDTYEPIRNPHKQLRPLRCSEFEHFAQAGRQHASLSQLFDQALDMALAEEESMAAKQLAQAAAQEQEQQGPPNHTTSDKADPEDDDASTIRSVITSRSSSRLATAGSTMSDADDTLPMARIKRLAPRTLVWARYNRYPWWPGLVDYVQIRNEAVHVAVSFFGDSTRETIRKPQDNLCLFRCDRFKKFVWEGSAHRYGNTLFLDSFEQALNEELQQAGLASQTLEDDDAASLGGPPQAVLRQAEVNDDIDGSDAEVDWVLQCNPRPATATSIANHAPASVRGVPLATSDEESDPELAGFIKRPVSPRRSPSKTSSRHRTQAPPSTAATMAPYTDPHAYNPALHAAHNTARLPGLTTTTTTTTSTVTSSLPSTTALPITLPARRRSRSHARDAPFGQPKAMDSPTSAVLRHATLSPGRDAQYDNLEPRTVAKAEALLQRALEQEVQVEIPDPTAAESTGPEQVDMLPNGLSSQLSNKAMRTLKSLQFLAPGKKMQVSFKQLSAREQRKLDAMAKRFAKQVTSTKRRRKLSKHSSRESLTDTEQDDASDAASKKPKLDRPASVESSV